MKRKYLIRMVDQILVEKLKYAGAVLIVGPKWCGKTKTALQNSKSSLFMQDPDRSLSYLKAADVKPSLLLEGETPRLIDEWQMAPVLWDAVRYTVDERNESGQFILTGSAVPLDNAAQHTGAGRISRVMMRPMSLYESLESSGSVSLKKLFDGEGEVAGISNLSIEDIAFAIVRGGWPSSIGIEKENALLPVVDYIETVIHADISRVDDVAKSPARVRALLQSLARNISTLATMSTIRNDIALGEDESLSVKTVSQYMNALKRIFVVDDIPAWNPALRSKTAIRTSPKRQFIDPSIATAILKMTPKRLLEDFNYFGFLFESLCARDLRVYAETLGGDVFHYRDKSGLEADAVVVLHDGRWAAIEVKLGSKEIEEAAQHLIQLRDKIYTEKMREPSFLMIVTGTEVAYQREDGVYVVPIGCLKN